MAAIKYHQFYVYDDLEARQISEQFVSEEHNNSRLFILIDLPRHKSDQRPLIEKIIETANTYFYNSSASDRENTLENILQALNKLLPELSQQCRIPRWIYSVDMVIGIIHGQQIILSGFGNMFAWLIHATQIRWILTKNAPQNYARIFSDIISGQLEENDALVISNSSIFDYLSQEKIKNIVNRYSPAAAAQQFHDLLKSVPAFVAFNCLLIKYSTDHDWEYVARTNPDPEYDGEETEPNTIIPSAKKIPSTRTKLALDPAALNKLPTFRIVKNFFLAVWLYVRVIFRIIKALIIFILGAAKYLGSQKSRHDIDDGSLHKIGAANSCLLLSWKKISRRKKIALSLLLAVLLLFLSSVMILGQNNMILSHDKNYRTAISQAQNLLGEVENKLMIADDTGAEKMLMQIDNDLQALTPPNQRAKQEIQQIRENVKHKLNQARHIHEVPEPVQIASANAPFADSRQIIQKNNILYLLDQGGLWQIGDQEPKKMTDVTNVWLMSDWPDKNRIILGNNESYLIYNLDDKQLQKFAISPDNTQTEIQDMDIYGNNLYVLDRKKSQIVKYSENQNSFGNGQNWLKDNIDLSPTNSFAIDGSVYLIDNQGEINRYTKGRRQDFSYHHPVPKIGSRAIIKTFRQSSLLYIADPDNQRIVILNKDGSIKDQFSSPKFDNIRDMAVDSNEQSLYLLNNDKIFLLPVK